jgi:undecaprenyl-diphosphatase
LSGAPRSRHNFGRIDDADDFGSRSVNVWRRMLEDFTESTNPRSSGWDRLARVDWPIARAMALTGDRRAPVVVAKALSRLGNGPIYFVILVALMYFQPQGAAAVALSAGASILLLHCVYPTIKRSAARPRPRDLGIACPGAPAPLDRYSFPSGHVMTLTAALLPIVLAAPRVWPYGLAIWAAMAWARLAVGDHFASDVAAGTLIGAGVSGLIAYWVVI